MAIGIGVLVLGILIWTGGMKWFGNLPGDIRVERENTRVFIPITSMIIVSIVLSLIINIARRIGSP